MARSARCAARLAARRGSALLLAIIGLFAVALLATAAVQLAASESSVQENSQAGAQALYMADQALSQYYQTYKPADNLTGMTLATVIDTTDGDIDTSQVFLDFSAMELKSSDIVNGRTTVKITPTKLMVSRLGDMYMMDATAITEDPRVNRPPAVRSLRTYARLAPPIVIRAALMAPGGLTAYKDNANRIILKGTTKDKCTASASIPSLATPAGLYDYRNAQKRDIEPDIAGIGHDSSAANYAELRDSLKYDWSVLSNEATYSGVPKSIVVPRDYPTLAAVPYSTFSSSGYWPVVLVKGNVTLDKELKGFGLLVVDGDLNVASGVLKWKGLILVGKRLTVVNGKDRSHTHIKGAVAAGLNCNPGTTEVLTGQCQVDLGSSKKDGEHLGIEYSSCNVQASWLGMLLLRPLTPTRHLRLY